MDEPQVTVQRIKPWRMVAGAAIHFVLPAYLLVVGWAAALGRFPEDLGKATLDAVALGVRFLLVYTTATAAAIVGVVTWERARGTIRADRPHPIWAQLHQPLAAAIGPAAERARQELERLLVTLPPERASPLARDAARVIDSAGAAVAAAPDHANAVSAQAAEALERLVTVGQQIVEERAAEAVTHAAVVGRYIRDKYHGSGDDAA